MSVYTVSHRIATTLRGARKLCIQELYREEPFILFVRAADMHPNWDKKLISCMEADLQSIISSHVARQGDITFPCVVDGRIEQRFLTDENTLDRIPSLLVQTEMVFLPSKALELVLASSDQFALSASLTENNYRLYVPGKSIATRRRRPVGVSRGRVNHVSAAAKRYARASGFGEEQTAKARLGLTPDAESAEMIAKYGSIVNTRLALQEEQAAMEGRP